MTTNATRTHFGSASAIVIGLILAVSGSASGQSSAPVSASAGVEVVTMRPERATLMRLQRPMTIEFKDQRLEDVMTYIREYTGADMEVQWTDDQSEALDPDFLVNMNVRNLPALAVIERILDKAQSDLSENGWQMTEFGAIEIGPKERLNKTRRVEMYDINDLLMVIPNFPDAPEIDLQSVLQGSEGGNSQSPFRDQQDEQEDEDRPTREERAETIIELITQNVEPDQWQDTGGEAATIRFFQGHLIVNAPDYVHRGLVGYSYWPSRKVVQSGSRRYVSLNMDTGISTVEDLNPYPVTAVVPGAGGGGGGGGAGSGGGTGTGTGGGSKP